MTSLLRDRSTARIGPICFAFVLALGAVACSDDGTDDEMSDETVGDGDGDMGDGDGDAPGDGDGDAVLSHAADIQPIWDASCVAACHEPGGSVGMVLDLSGDAYAAIVGVASMQAPGLSLVEPGDPAASYLVAKLRGTQIAAGGVGGQMPVGVDPLPEETIAQVEAWIAAGAAP